jgi:hypothetical protein
MRVQACGRHVTSGYLVSKQGFEVEHIPWEDPLHSKTPPEQVQRKFLAVRKAALLRVGAAIAGP